MSNQGCYIKYKGQDPLDYFCWIENFSNLKCKILPWVEAFALASKAEENGAKIVCSHKGIPIVLHLILDDKDGQECHYLLGSEVYLLNNSGGTIEVLKKKG